MTKIPSRLVLLLLAFNLFATPLTAQQVCQAPAIPTPVAGENIFTEEQEMDLGDAVAQHIERNFSVIDDEEVTRYLRQIGERIIKHLPPTKLRFKFLLFDVNEVNAFTTPGGRIYVSRKMIAFARNEDELAGVVAHELGHIVARHASIDMTALMREVIGVTQVGDKKDVFEKYNQLIENTARKPKAVEKLANHEEGNQNVADLIGLYAMVRAGYDPQAQALLWDRYNDLKGKTGGFFNDLFGRTRPEQKRLREMLRSLATLPAECRAPHSVANETEFQKWQSQVVAYSGAGKKESLNGVIAKTSLSPALRSDINHGRFSPDGKFILVQDDSGISVLSRQPLGSLFRIDAPDARPAQFSPDSRTVVFYTPGLRVETWDIATQKLKSAHEVVLRKKCAQTSLSPDASTLACLDTELGLSLFDVATSAVIVEKKAFTQIGFLEAFEYILTALLAGDDAPDANERPLINMVFSPDGRYFVAGDQSQTFNGMGIFTETQSLLYDLTTHAALPAKGEFKKAIAGGFAFVGADKIIGRNGENLKKSGLFRFPSGEVIENFEVYSASMKPVTAGGFVILKDFGKLSGSMLDVSSRKVTTINDRNVLDRYEDVIVVEQLNSQLQILNLASSVEETLTLPPTPLGRVYAVDVTPDLNWLAVSGHSRGAVWDVAHKQMVLYVRGFRGAFLENDNLFADFPTFDQTQRNIAHLSLRTREGALGPTVPERSARQIGDLVVDMRPAKTGGSYSENVTLEIKDARTMTTISTLNFLKERPRYWVAPRENSIVLVWPIKSKAAEAEIKQDPNLAHQLTALKETEGDYLVKVIDAHKGNQKGAFLMETGKGSFRLRDVAVSAERIAVSDNQNRTLVYSLADGQTLGKVFGSGAALSPSGNLLCVETKEGTLELYDVPSFEKRQEYSFGGRLSYVHFSLDGSRLFVLTADQNVYVLDTTIK